MSAETLDLEHRAEAGRAPLRSLHVVASLDERMGGSVRAPLMLADALVESGGETTVVGTCGPDDEVDYLLSEFPRVETRLFTRTAPHHNFRSPELRRWLQANVSSYDVVDIHGLFSFAPLYAAWACRRRGVPYVVHPHGSLEPYDLRKHAQMKWVYNRIAVRPVLHGASGVVLITDTERDRLQSFGVSVARRVVPLPVQAATAEGDAAAFRRSLGIAGDAPLVLFIGRVDEKKGLQFLIPACAELRRDRPDLHLAVVGTGEPSAERLLDRLLAENDTAGWATRCGFLSGAEKAGAYAASDVFALPSLNENFGISVVESLQAGLPVIVSDEVYIHGELEQAEVAEVCMPTIASCRDALAALLADPARRSAIAQRGPAVARRLFSPEAVAARLDGTYRELVG